MIPITLALLTTVVYSLNSVVGRFVVSKGTISAQQMMADCYLLLTVVFATIFALSPHPYPLSILLTVGGISILGALGAFLITEAVVYGKGGPAHALTEVQSLYVLILEVVILGKIPSIKQVIGFTFGFVGGACIAFESKKEAEKELESEDKKD
jgi:drug/metabolite transporter (DMT)-like permease